jgi:hypothetical protein
MIGNGAVPRFSEAVFEVLWSEAGGGEVGEIVSDELAQDAFRCGALDLAHGRIERRDVAGDLGERFVDERIEAIADCVVELRQRGGGAFEIVVRQRAVKAFEDAVIELAFVARIELQLVLGIVDVAHAEDVFEEKLLRTFTEVFELRR